MLDHFFNDTTITSLHTGNCPAFICTSEGCHHVLWLFTRNVRQYEAHIAFYVSYLQSQWTQLNSNRTQILYWLFHIRLKSPNNYIGYKNPYPQCQRSQIAFTLYFGEDVFKIPLGFKNVFGHFSNDIRIILR